MKWMRSLFLDVTTYSKTISISWEVLGDMEGILNGSYITTTKKIRDRSKK